MRVPRRSGDQPRDSGLAEIMGNLLLTLVGLSLAAGFAAYLYSVQPTPHEVLHGNLGYSLDPGTQGWGNGDEQVVVTHRGGEALKRLATKVHIVVGATTVSYESAELYYGFTDGDLTIGESWRGNLSIGTDQEVTIEIVSTKGGSRVVASSTLRSGAEDCSTDTAAPTTKAWTQSPADVSTVSPGDVTVTVTLTDDCAGVDEAVDPVLYYRLDDGTAPTFTSLGAMTKLSPVAWQATIPEPVLGWDDHADETLEYYIDTHQDLRGNDGTSATRRDEVQTGVLGGTLTYVNAHVNVSGNVTWFSRAQNGTDGGLGARIWENATSTDSDSSEAHATAHSSSGVPDPGNVTGAPDDAHTTLADDRDWVGASGFDTLQGAITTVELGFEAHYDGLGIGSDDALVISYEVSGSAGPTSQAYDASDLSSLGDGPPRYVNVTADRAWSWTDIADLMVKAEYDKQGAEDDLDFLVDALWVRVGYDDPAYNLTIRMNVTGVPTATDHYLELGYYVVNETFHVKVWDFTTLSWNQRGNELTDTVPSSWTYVLTRDEVNGAGKVRVRLVDVGPGGVDRGIIWLDHLRVRSV